MRSSRASKAIVHRDGWTIDVRITALYVIAFVLVVGLLTLLIGREGKWLFVHGVVQDERLVADHALETKWGGQVMWRAEYKVAYAADGGEYSVWADSGIRGESETVVRLALPQSYVRYDTRPNGPKYPLPFVGENQARTVVGERSDVTQDRPA